MAIVNKNSSETQPSSSEGPSKPPQQQGFDIGVFGVMGLIENYFWKKIRKYSNQVFVFPPIYPPIMFVNTF